MQWRIAADMAVGFGVAAAGAALFAARIVSRRELLLLAAGTLIGLVFESYIVLAGPEFFTLLVRWPLPMWTFVLCHSLWDGGLFMAGYALAGVVARRPRGEVCARFDARELAAMTAWGAGSAFVVEMIGNGVMWLYHPLPWNPVWITVRGQGYTAFIQVVWCMVPAVFYAVCLASGKMTPRARDIQSPRGQL